MESYSLGLNSDQKIFCANEAMFIIWLWSPFYTFTVTLSWKLLKWSFGPSKYYKNRCLKWVEYRIVCQNMFPLCYRTTSCLTSLSLLFSLHLEWLVIGQMVVESGTMRRRTSWCGSMRKIIHVSFLWKRVETWRLYLNVSAKGSMRWVGHLYFLQLQGYFTNGIIFSHGPHGLWQQCPLRWGHLHVFGSIEPQNANGSLWNILQSHSLAVCKT